MLDQWLDFNMVMIRDGGSEEGGDGAHIYCRELGEVLWGDRQGPDMNGKGVFVSFCLHLGLKCETWKEHRQKKLKKNGNKVLSSKQISSSSSVGSGQPFLLPPSRLPSGFLSLSRPLWHSLCLSPPPLRASCLGSWFALLCLGLSESCERLLFRSITADREQLTQG